MKLRNLLLSGVIAISLPVKTWAAPGGVDANAIEVATEGSICEQCEVVKTSEGMRLKDNLGVVANNLESINNKLNFSNQCSKFADEGHLGAWAKSIRTIYMNGDLQNLEEGSADIKKYCPNYEIMKPTDKANFWVLILNAMAHFENSCNVSNPKPAKGPNGTLVGILQLHAANEGKYTSGDCRNGDGRTAEGSFRCGMLMLDNQIKKQKALFSQGSYWDVLRPQAKSRRVPVIINAIKKYVPCQDETKLNVRHYMDENAQILNALQQMDDQNDLGTWKVKDLTIPVNVKDYEL